MTKDPNNIDNWQLSRIYFDDTYENYDEIIVGFVNGKFVKSSTLLYLDLEEKIVMTDKEVFKIGEPNNLWLTAYLQGGKCLDDIEIKGTTH